MHILIVIVVGSNPTWANFLYQLLKAFTQMWIPQVSLRERELETVREWEKEREWEIKRKRECERVRDWEWERIREWEMARVRVRKCENELEKVREAEWEYIEIQPNLCEHIWNHGMINQFFERLCRLKWLWVQISLGWTFYINY